MTSDIIFPFPSIKHRTFAECLTVRRHTDLPFVMDETVNDVGSLLDCHREAAADVVNIKISKFGGLTKAKQAGNFITIITK